MRGWQATEILPRCPDRSSPSSLMRLMGGESPLVKPKTDHSLGDIPVYLDRGCCHRKTRQTTGLYRCPSGMETGALHRVRRIIDGRDFDGPGGSRIRMPVDRSLRSSNNQLNDTNLGSRYTDDAEAVSILLDHREHKRHLTDGGIASDVGRSPNPLVYRYVLRGMLLDDPMRRSTVEVPSERTITPVAIRQRLQERWKEMKHGEIQAQRAQMKRRCNMPKRPGMCNGNESCVKKSGNKIGNCSQRASRKKCGHRSRRCTRASAAPSKRLTP